jgi:UMF1 family MFS transporter
LWLRERAVPDPDAKNRNHFVVGFKRLQQTIAHARHYRDLFNFLVTLFVYSCGTQTVIHLASVYAQNVFKFTTKDSVAMIFVVDITAAVGAVVFGFIQDRIGSIRTLIITLAIWTVAITCGSLAQEPWQFWLASNVVGIALGASGSVGRALVGQFSPHGRSGEFLGLWGMAVKLATCFGAMAFGLITYLTHGNYHAALMSCTLYFVIGIVLLFRVDEARGRRAALQSIDDGTAN